MTCCQNIFNTKFDTAKAAADLSDYLKNGIKKNSRPLLKLIVDLDLNGCHVLDIGSGIGAITFELLERGAGSASLVDISSAYIEAFKKEATRRNLEGFTRTYAGDCITLAEKLPKSKLLVMDKVICCYPEWMPLIRTAGRLSTQWIAFSLPRHVWWVEVGEWLDTKWRSLRGDFFPTYIHPTTEIDHLLCRLGFRLDKLTTWREWEYRLYVRE